MQLFRSNKPKETRDEPEVPPKPAAPDPRTVNTMPDSRAAAPAPTPAPKPAGSEIPQGVVPTLGGAPSPAPTPAPEPPRPVPPPPPPAPKAIPDADALRSVVEQAVRDSEGSKLEAVRIGGGPTAPAMMLGGNLNFPALYEKAGVPDPSFAAEQMLVMLAKLPTGMPLEMKRETVNVTLEMLGKKINTTEESIVGDTTRKMTTLASFTQEYERKTKERVAQGEAEIADLLAQVEAKRQAVAAANQRLGTIQTVCAKETDRLNEVLEFFKAKPPAVVGQVFKKDGQAAGGDPKKPAVAEGKPEPKPLPASPIAPVKPEPVSSDTTVVASPISIDLDDDKTRPMAPIANLLNDSKAGADAKPGDVTTPMTPAASGSASAKP